jgi:hypothetical protein
MTLFYNVVGIVSLVFVAVGFLSLWKLGWYGTGQDICLLAFPAAIALGFGVYILHLRDRIAALEKRARESE